MAYKTWMQYRRRAYPSIKLNRLKEDQCDHCVKLQAILADEHTSALDRAEVSFLQHLVHYLLLFIQCICLQIQAVLNQHQDNARNQRYELKQLLKTFLGEQKENEVSVENIPNFIDDPVDSLPAGSPEAAY